MQYIFSSSPIFLVAQLVLALAKVWKAFLFDLLSENNEAAAILGRLFHWLSKRHNFKTQVFSSQLRSFKLSFFYFTLAPLKLWIRKLEYQKSNFPCFLSHWFDTRPIRILECTYLIYNHSKWAVPERGKLTEHHDESNVQWVARQIVKSGRLILLSACSMTKIKAILRSRSSVTVRVLWHIFN